MKHINLLIKPASGLCNLRCRYCFYHDLAKERQEKQFIMTGETADLLIDRAVNEAEQGIGFMFQGGEPTLAGLDFFRRFVSQVELKKKPHQQISYGIQTNGMVINEEWAQFLAQNNFLVGLSLDGQGDLHDLHRLDIAGKGSFRRVMDAKKAFDAAGTQYNILCVVTAAAASHARQLYSWFKKQGFQYLQFIACIDPIEAARGGEKFSLTPERYGRFLCDLFDPWFEDWSKGQYVSVRLFDDYVHILAGIPSGTCATSGSCGSYLVIESDGGAYPCDFYVTRDWLLGNIKEMNLEQLFNSEKARRFLLERAPNTECPGCQYYRICRGGCKRDCQMPNGELGNNYFCKAFKIFFEHAMPKLKIIANAEKRAMGIYKKST